jgi:hypothetical protein
MRQFDSPARDAHRAKFAITSNDPSLEMPQKREANNENFVPPQFKFVVQPFAK